jgi:hypothetical protein
MAEPDSLYRAVRRTHVSEDARVAGRVRVEVGNRITRRMMRLPSGESRGGELDPDLLGLGFASSGVGDGGSSLW